jgi:ATP-dependent phosphoenolpyruvate carboxykinase
MMAKTPFFISPAYSVPRITISRSSKLRSTGELQSAPVEQDDYFGLAQVTKCSGVPNEILRSAKNWSDEKAYRDTAAKLASLFRINFEKFAEQAGPEVTNAGPKAFAPIPTK